MRKQATPKEQGLSETHLTIFITCLLHARCLTVFPNSEKPAESGAKRKRSICTSGAHIYPPASERGGNRWVLGNANLWWKKAKYASLAEHLSLQMGRLRLDAGGKQSSLTSPPYFCQPRRTRGPGFKG